MVTLDAKGVYYKDLNEQVKALVEQGETEFVLENVNGQRYIADGISRPVTISIHGVPGNDLAAFMDGPQVICHSNVQDGVGNTMNSGKIVVHGQAGDVVGYGMRGGKIFIRGDVGYRVGIHMKGFLEQVPYLVIGGVAGSFLGEYMAGGVLILLGLDRPDEVPIAGPYLATGMHGGVIYVRGEVSEHQVGAEVGIMEPEEEDMRLLEKTLSEYCSDFGLDVADVMKESFLKIIPVSHRPYGNLYAY
jgi:glutamate synthase domain-containing protein 3